MTAPFLLLERTRRRRARRVRRTDPAGGALYRTHPPVRRAGRHVGHWVAVTVLGALLAVAALTVGLLLLLAGYKAG